MSAAPASNLSAPRTMSVPVAYGTKIIHVRAWTMAQHDEMLPLVAALIDGWLSWQDRPEEISLTDLIVRFSREVSAICRATTREELAGVGLEWDDLELEDLFVIAQAIWQTSIARPGGGGLMGKAATMIAPLMGAALQKAKARSASGSGSAQPTAPQNGAAANPSPSPTPPTPT